MELAANRDDAASAEALGQPAARSENCLELIEACSKVKSLEPVLQRIASIPQVSSPAKVCFLKATLSLCNSKPEETEEVSRTLASLLSRPEVIALLANFAKLTDLSQAVSLLDVVRVQPEVAVLTACTEFTALLVFFQRNGVTLPIGLRALRQKPSELSRLIQACTTLLQRKSICLVGLCTELLKALEDITESESLFFIPALAAELLPFVPEDRIEELGSLLLVASRDPVQMQTVKKLQVNLDQVRSQLVRLLKGSKKLTISALKSLLSQPPESMELVQVKSEFLRFFDCGNLTWRRAVVLRSPIKVDPFSSWALLVNGQVFCSGGGKHQAGYYSKGISYLEAWKTAYLLNRNGAVSVQPDMLTARFSHGIIGIDDSVYVLGGGEL